MKKSIVLSFAFCSFFSLLSGQNKWNIGPSVTLGLSGEKQFQEINYNNTRSDGFEESKVLPSLGAGIQIERLFGKRWSINLATQYSYIQRFERVEYNYFSSPLNSLTSFNSSKRKLTSHQIQAPIQVHFYFGKPNKIRPYLSLGGQISYSVSAKHESESIYVSNREAYINDWSNEYNFKEGWAPIERFSTSMIYGLGLAFKGFSVEMNRVQNVLKTANNGHSLNYYNAYVLHAPAFVITPVTTISVKYWL